MMDWINNIISGTISNIKNSIESIIKDNQTAIFTIVGISLVIFIIYSIIMDDDYLR